MQRRFVLVILGALVALSPYLGLPYSWLMVILPVLGFVIVLVALLGRTRRVIRVPDTAAPLPGSHEAPPYA